MLIPSRTPVPTSFLTLIPILSQKSHAHPPCSQLPQQPPSLRSQATHRETPPSCPTSCSWPGPGPTLIDHRPFYQHLLAQIKTLFPPPSPLRFFPFLPLSLSPARRILVYIKVPFSVWCVKTTCAAIQLLRVDQQPGIHFPSVNTSELSSTILLSPTQKKQTLLLSVQFPPYHSHLNSPQHNASAVATTSATTASFWFLFIYSSIHLRAAPNIFSRLAVIRVCTPCATLVHHGRQRLPCVEHADRVG